MQKRCLCKKSDTQTTEGVRMKLKRVNQWQAYTHTLHPVSQTTCSTSSSHVDKAKYIFLLLCKKKFLYLQSVMGKQTKNGLLYWLHCILLYVKNVYMLNEHQNKLNLRVTVLISVLVCSKVGICCFWCHSNSVVSYYYPNRSINYQYRKL